MSDQQHTIVTTWSQFKTRWDGLRNFMLADQCLSLTYPMPPIDRVVEELRQDELVRIGSGMPGDRLCLEDFSEIFRKTPIDEALEAPFSLAHFRLSRFDAPGKILHGFSEQVLEPWKRDLTANGFTFDRCYPIIFISGSHCATNYHVDFSHVLAWQVYGSKRFCGLKDPDRWAPKNVRLNYKPGGVAKPSQLTDDDALCYQMQPGDALWNSFLTPHWVEAADQPSMSINISHGGLRLEGKLCPWEQQLEQYRRDCPDHAPAQLSGQY